MKKTHLLFLTALCCAFLCLVSCERDGQYIDSTEENLVLDSNETLNQWIDEAIEQQPLSMTKRPVQTVDTVDINRYAGRWFEIANFPTFFNQNCICTTADYGPIPGGVSVLNNCVSTVTGEFNTIVGSAIVVDTNTNAKLKVFLGDIPFPGDYWIIDLIGADPDAPYDFAVVSDPSRENLFILSRTPMIHTIKQKIAVIKILINLIRQGYDIRKIQISPQLENCRYI